MAWNEPGNKGNTPWGSPSPGGGGYQNLLQKLGSLLGGGAPDEQGSFGLAGLILLVLLALWGALGFYQLDEQQRAVILRLGAFHDIVGPGFHWNPPLVDTVVRENVTQQRSYSTQGAMLTEDENIVDIRFTVQYRLKDARAYLFENHRPDEAVVQAAESAVREIVGRSKVDQVLYEQRDAIASDLMKSLQAQLDRLNAGILIANVNVQNVQVPEQVQAAFNDAVKAGADRDRFKNEGQAYASDVIPKARGTAARLKEEAEGDAQRFRSVLTEYQKAPAVTRDRLYIETMQQVYANVSKVMVDSRNGSNLLYLPLDKLMQQGGTPQTSAGAPSSTEAAGSQNVAPPASPADPRTRDGARARDRDNR